MLDFFVLADIKDMTGGFRVLFTYSIGGICYIGSYGTLFFV